MSSTTIRNQLHFQLGSQCALCREQRPKDPYTFNTGEEFSLLWQRKFLTICTLSDDEQPTRVLSALTDFTTPDYLYKLLPLSHATKQLPKIEICFHSGCSQPHRIAHCIHVQCWKLVYSCVKCDNLNATIYELARSTYQLFENPLRIKKQPESITDFTQAIRERGLGSDVGRFLNFLSRFPIDIQLEISQASIGSPLSTALVVCKSSTALLRFILKHGWKSRTVTVSVDSRFKRISAQWVRIYGKEYLSDLKSGQACDTPSSLPLWPIRGIKFALGLYGIQALKLLYINNTESAWLGSESGGWIGTIYGTNITGLELLRDDLKCVRIDLAQAPNTLYKPPEDFVMWDRDIWFSNAQTNYILNSVEDLPMIQHYYGWRLARYNPLRCGEEYVTGITIYCSFLGVKGIVTHGKSSILTGSRIGCPIHLPLQSGEHIVSIWVSRPADLAIPSMKSPNLLMLTNRGRTQVFSPVLDGRTIQHLGRRWEPLGNDRVSPVISIFYDALTVNYGDIMTFGITKEQCDDYSKFTQAKIQQPLVPRPNNVLRHCNNFLSIGNLVGVSKLDIRRNRGRCFGLWIEHHDGTVQILGQWDPSITSEISRIYDCTQGTLKEICFCSEGIYITNILLGFGNEVRVQKEDIEMVGKVFYLKDLTKHIAWWFTTDVDCVELWDGIFKEAEWTRSEARRTVHGARADVLPPPPPANRNAPPPPANIYT